MLSNATDFCRSVRKYNSQNDIALPIVPEIGHGNLGTGIVDGKHSVERLMQENSAIFGSNLYCNRPSIRGDRSQSRRRGRL